MCVFFFFQAEDGIRVAQESRGLGDVYKGQGFGCLGLWLRVWGSEAPGVWVCGSGCIDSGCVGLWLRVCGSAAPGVWVGGYGCMGTAREGQWLRVVGSAASGVCAVCDTHLTLATNRLALVILCSYVYRT